MSLVCLSLTDASLHFSTWSEERIAVGHFSSRSIRRPAIAKTNVRLIHVTNTTEGRRILPTTNSKYD
jgi:hypothetical protein